jgi:hypothetical protein
MGSAVDRANLTRELTRYRDAGLGGVHLVPIYGAKGWEDRYVPFLSPAWMELLGHAVAEADRLGLGVDVTTGSGWCFGGPHVTEEEANALAVPQLFAVASGGALGRKFAPRPQALMAFGPNGKTRDLLPQLAADGTVSWRAEGGPWQVISVTQKPSGQRVKRAGPGGTGWMLNLLQPTAMTHYLRGFEAAYAAHPGPRPRAQYHDSYEYRSDWAPGIFDEFEKRRGYRLQEHLDVVWAKEPPDPERAARVQGDLRETMSDVLIEASLPQWTAWARGRGMLTRNQAHGSPGHLLDLYALADIPETEMFNRDRNPLVAKFASSAAHVAGRRLIAAETGTWLREHFTETLADLKYLVDDLWVSGVNHVFYHGTCYSPDEAPWPGWLFYASTQLNPRNPIWRDVPALNAYVARGQALLQAGRPDADVLLYWPLHDTWHHVGPLEQKMTVHKLEWFEGRPVGLLAGLLGRRGYAFDYVSDRQLAGARAQAGRVVVPGGEYRVVVVPACERLPLGTLVQLLALADAGATVVFERELPSDVPGWADLANRRAELRRLTSTLAVTRDAGSDLRRARVGRGLVLVGEIETALQAIPVPREPLVDYDGLQYVRRAATDGSRVYFLANRSAELIDDWIPLAAKTATVIALDPMTGRTGIAASRPTPWGMAQVQVRLEAGASLFLRVLPVTGPSGPVWNWEAPGELPVPITENWRVSFIAGGPEQPPTFETRQLASWTELGGDSAQRFAGTARYALVFDAPAGDPARWLLDLGRVSQSARVRLNGAALGTVFVPPFRVALPPLRLTGNLLEVEVTNVAANRIRDLDRRQVPWRVFHDINLVNIDYKPFDASGWPVREAGLLGPVMLVPAAEPSAVTLP